MAENFAERFVSLSGECLASEIPAKLRLDHRKGGLDVRALVIVVVELALIHLVVIEHPMPHINLAGRFGVGRERG